MRRLRALFGRCISCGVGLGEEHYSWCPQRSAQVLGGAS